MKSKFYVVWKGHTPGIYSSWADCQKQTVGYAGAQYKAFDNLQIAEKAYSESYWKAVNKQPKSKEFPTSAQPIVPSISVDAACSGNPGVLEYRGVDTATGKTIFHQKFPEGTNNIGEFLAIVHALALVNQKDNSIPIYSDSEIALKWVRKKICKTQLEHKPQTEKLYEIIDRALNWLQTHTYTNPVLKWNTAGWGQVPADFGRK